MFATRSLRSRRWSRREPKAPAAMRSRIAGSGGGEGGTAAEPSPEARGGKAKGELRASDAIVF